MDMDVIESQRPSLEADRDTKGVPGSPPIFETILSKIKAAEIFVADLTFIGKRDNDNRLVSNPNVLIEYGFALNALGDARIIGIMNAAYGEPSDETMPFNLKGRRFPMHYCVPEDASDDDVRATRKTFTKELAGALRTILESPAYKASERTLRKPTALEIAAAHRADLDLKAEIDSLRYRSEAPRVREAAEDLLERLDSKIREIEKAFNYGIELGLQCGGGSDPCLIVRLRAGVSFHLVWEQTQQASINEYRLHGRWFRGRLVLPGEPFPALYRPPAMASEMFYRPTLSRSRELGWAKVMGENAELDFVPTDDLVEILATAVVNMLRAI
ncbi:hypothetical protein SAMN05421771_1372 [Granulicella pectinivorans]|uniref:CD-NTase-associated protein 12/Pycsar effector protein TIR domain-containing protein n=2 Tax=Granulicella pectinivorans TaxID=474950 RepID=A0A1I6LW65_9BACT|nr:hypothetical protein SAMN05421771_1372 [Granulicella pectinivorans]